MNGIAILVALAAVGVDYGWQPASDGQLEYIIQIEPAMLDALKNGRTITSEIHPDARDVRRFRIQVGTGVLPRVGVLAANNAPARLSTSDSDPQSPAVTATSGTVYGSSSSVAAGPLADGLAATSLETPGILNLPPPPPLVGPDGKASVLVRPGDRALPGATAPTTSPLPSYDSAPPNNTPSVPAVPPAGSGSWQVPNAPAAVPTAPNTSWPAVPGGSFPVPAAGPETGLPEPIRGAGLKPDAPTSIDAMASNQTPNQPTTRDLLNQFAANQREAAAQKPTIDKEEAERLINERARELQAQHPWPPLVFTALALFGSLAANLYLGWIASGTYRRYRDVCDELHEAQASMT